MSVTYGYSLNDEISIAGGNWAGHSPTKTFRLTSFHTNGNDEYAIWSLLQGGTATVANGFTVHWDSANSTNIIGTEMNINSNDQSNNADPSCVSLGSSNSGARTTSISIPSNNTTDIWMYSNNNAQPSDKDVVLAWNANLLFSSSGGGGGGFLSNNPEITDITFAKIDPHEIQVDFKYDNIRVSTAQDPEYVMIKNVTRDTTLWSEHVDANVSQQATRSIVMNNKQGTYSNLFGHGDLIQVMHSTPSYEANDINYGTQVRSHTYMASGPYNVTFGPENPTGYIPVVIEDSNLFPDNAARPVFYDSTGNRMSDSNGVEFLSSQNHDIHLNSTPAYYTAFALIKSETEPYCNLHIIKYYDAENGGYTGPQFHTRFGYKRNKKVSHNFW